MIYPIYIRFQIEYLLSTSAAINRYKLKAMDAKLRSHAKNEYNQREFARLVEMYNERLHRQGEK